MEKKIFSKHNAKHLQGMTEDGKRSGVHNLIDMSYRIGLNRKINMLMENDVPEIPCVS